MVNYWNRIRYVDDKHKQAVNPLVYPFLFATIIYGLGFIASPILGTAVSTSSLFTAMGALHNFLPPLWGICALLAGTLGTYCLLTRHTKYISATASMLGVMVWLFATFIYIGNGFFLVTLTVATVNLYFWVWWYIRLKWYQRRKAAGLLVDSD